jgi:hypothetical protein
MTNKITIIIGIILIISLAACSTPTVVTTPTQTQNPEQTAQYPGPLGEIVDTTSYPSPAINNNSTNPLLPTYTTDPQMGSVTGRLLLNDKGVGDALLYLAAVVKDKSGKDIVAGLDRMNSPNVRTDTQGTFNFVNVAAGRYALILDVVTSQSMINYPDKETPIIVDVTAGKAVDLGVLNYDSLPLPSK